MGFKPKKVEKPEEKFCPYCDRRGIVYNPGFELMIERPLLPCPKCVEPKCTCDKKSPYYINSGREIIDCTCREVRIKIDKIIGIYDRCGVDRKFRWKHFGDYEAVDKKANDAKNAAYDIVSNFPNIRKGIFFWGNPGTGKTLLSCIILTELIVRHAIEGRFIKISRTFFSRLKATFIEGSATYGQTSRIEKDLAEADFLVIDDFGVQRDSAWEQETLYNLIDARYEAEKFTIITSNSNPASFKELSEGRILSRIKEMCRLMELSGKDYREGL